MGAFGRARRIAVAWLSSLVIALVASTAVADGDHSPWVDQNGVVPLSGPSTDSTATGADPGPDPVPEITTSVERPPSRLAKWGSFGGIVGVYAAATTFMYFAWYYGQPSKPFKFGGDGYFGGETYAGGADKLGHAWANNMWAGLTSTILVEGGWKRWQAALIAPSITLGLFTLVEVKDGLFYEFSPGDELANALGATLAGLRTAFPRINRLIDFRVEYYPSKQYIDLVEGRRPPEDPTMPHQVSLNIAEDYSGQRYLLALHLGGLPGLEDQTWARLVDVAVGYETKGYKPQPIDPVDRTRHLFLGLTLNAQGLFDLGLRHRKSRIARAAHHVTNQVFEYFNVPFTSAAVVGPTGRLPPGFTPE